MALTRKLLKGMGLSEEQIDSVCDAHSETLEGMKERIRTLEEEAGKLKAVQKELDELRGGKDYKAELERVKKEFDAYRAEVGAKETASKVRAAYRELLRAANVDGKRIDAILRATDMKDMKLDGEGKLENADKLTEAIKAEWSDFIVTGKTRGADVKTPPTGGKVTRTRDEIMAIKDDKERQEAIAENHELFGF